MTEKKELTATGILKSFFLAASAVLGVVAASYIVKAITEPKDAPPTEG